MLSTAPTAGNTLIAVISTRGTSASQISSISGGASTWTRATQTTVSSGTTTEIWYGTNIVARASTNVVITQAASLRSAAVVIEYSGLLVATTLDKTNSASGTNSSPVTGTTVATTVANEVWIGGISFTNSTYTLSSPLNGFNVVASAHSTNAIASTNAVVYALEYLASATGTASSGGTLSTGGAWAGAIATFQSQSSVGLTLGGNGVQTNYTMTGFTDTVTINPTNLTVMAASYSKIYDGTTSAVGTPTITAGNIQPCDTAPVWTESFNSKNAGPELLTPAGVVIDGNGGANYHVTYATAAGTIYQTNLTVTAAANDKLYDSTTSAAASATITAGSIQPGDTAPVPWTETYASKNVGTSLTLTPTGVVNDGNGGANYAYTYQAEAVGEIDQTNITVTAVPNTKPYDGTITAAGMPTVTAGAVQVNDTAVWTETYATPAVGIGLTLTPAGVVNDGNGGANYAYTYTAVNTGEIDILGTTTLLAVDINPSGYTTNVTFTATVTGNLPTVGEPSGSVVLLTNGTPFATNGPLIAGVGQSTITFGTSLLPVGTNYMTAQYLGDGNFSPSSGMESQVVTNYSLAITNEVASLTNCAGSPAIFTVGASGEDLTYQWQVSGDGGITFTNISDTATNASYTNVAPTLADSGLQYQVIVSATARRLRPRRRRC